MKRFLGFSALPSPIEVVPEKSEEEVENLILVELAGPAAETHEFRSKIHTGSHNQFFKMAQAINEGKISSQQMILKEWSIPRQQNKH